MQQNSTPSIHLLSLSLNSGQRANAQNHPNQLMHILCGAKISHHMNIFLPFLAGRHYIEIGKITELVLPC
jgi:hypothetical protein